jgi:uncharacterized membrane protein
MLTDSHFDHGPVANNIQAVLKLEQDDQDQLSLLHRASHRIGGFVGTIYFAVLQSVGVLFWVLWNVRASATFDPYPFPLLSTVLCFEAVLLTSFVLIRQNAMSRQSERRNHLDLQINLLAEKETTSILKALGEIAKQLRVDLSGEAENEQLVEDTPVESIARDLRSNED